MKHITLSMLKEILARMKPEEKDKLIQQLFTANKVSKSLVESLLGVVDTKGCLQDAREQIALYIGGKRGTTLKRNKAKNAITHYHELTQDPVGTIDLILYYISKLMEYSNEYGYYYHQYTDSWIMMFEKALKMVSKYKLSVDQMFEDRFVAMSEEDYPHGWIRKLSVMYQQHRKTS